MKVPWARLPELAQLNSSFRSSIMVDIDFQFIRIDDMGLAGSFKLLPAAQQPFGALHGGISCYIGESLASIGANLCLSDSQAKAVGQSLQVYHLRPCFQGEVIASTWPQSISAGSQLWLFQLEQGPKILASGSLAIKVIRGP